MQPEVILRGDSYFDNYREDWQALELKEELIQVDGRQRLMGKLTEEVFDEAPWTATFETRIVLSKGNHLLEIKVMSDLEDISMIISDWVVEVVV